MNLSTEWLKAAYLDLENIKYIVNVEHLSSVTAFHSQQAIEKCFKSLVQHKYNKVKNQHDLLKLYESVSDLINIDALDNLDTLNQLYIDSRYPGDMGLLPYGKPSLEDAQEFYEFTFDIFNQVCIILNVDPDEVK
ncbi:MAG: HEPN domain-containing protein, partial [Campylobacterota bacterium]|nr:HEPN domain-containing protein [Campylobacterota bacterium]